MRLASEPGAQTPTHSQSREIGSAIYMALDDLRLAAATNLPQIVVLAGYVERSVHGGECG